MFAHEGQVVGHRAVARGDVALRGLLGIGGQTLDHHAQLLFAGDGRVLLPPDERGHELAVEGCRRKYLIRFGKYNGTWWCKPSASHAYTELYPIPRERLGANPNLRQNPGYTK